MSKSRLIMPNNMPKQSKLNWQALANLHPKKHGIFLAKKVEYFQEYLQRKKKISI